MIALDDTPSAEVELQSLPTMNDGFWDLAPALVWVATRSSDHVGETPKDAGTVDLMVRFRRWHRTELVASSDPNDAWTALAQQIALGKVRAYGFEGIGIVLGNRRQIDHQAIDLRLDMEPSDVPGRSYLKLYGRGGTAEFFDLQIAREDLLAAFPVRASSAPEPVRHRVVVPPVVLKPTRRGPPLTYSPEAVQAAKDRFVTALADRGEPWKHDDDPGWQTQGALEALIADTMAGWQQYPKPTWLKTKRREWLNEWTQQHRASSPNN